MTTTIRDPLHSRKVKQIDITEILEIAQALAVLSLRRWLAEWIHLLHWCCLFVSLAR